MPEGLSDEEKEPIFAELAALSDNQKAVITRDILEPQLRNFLSPWWRFFLTYDPRPTLRRVQVPMLAINGDKDLQVPGSEKLAEIKAALSEGGNGDFSIVALAESQPLLPNERNGLVDRIRDDRRNLRPGAVQCSRRLARGAYDHADGCARNTRGRRTDGFRPGAELSQSLQRADLDSLCAIASRSGRVERL